MDHSMHTRFFNSILRISQYTGLSYIYHRFSYFLLSVIFVVPLLCADVYLTYFVSTA